MELPRLSAVVLEPSGIRDLVDVHTPIAYAATDSPEEGLEWLRKEAEIYIQDLVCRLKEEA